MRLAARFALSLTVLASCSGAPVPVWAPDAAVQKYRHVHDGPPEIVLYTVVSRRSGSGAHSGLLINGRQRILFDPAGTFSLPFVPERNDVHYGMTDRALAIYIDYHARETYDLVEHRLPVTRAQADRIAQLAKAYGPVPKARCSLAITRILAQVPGFETISPGYFPNRLSKAFGRLPGAQSRTVTDDDADQNEEMLSRFQE